MIGDIFGVSVKPYRTHMPQHISSVKRVRQDAKRRLHNRALRSNMRTLVKTVLKATTKADGEAALTKAIAYLDRMATKNIIHKNNAGHKKSLLVRYVAKLA